MPLDFNSTKQFRDFLLSRTLQVPNGPQTFTSNNYVVQNLRDLPNVDPGAVDTNRLNDLSIPQTTNIFKPLEFFIKDNFDTLPRRANLSLYYNGTPYFTSGNYNLVGIMSNDNYDNESELFKFAASYIRDRNQRGPVYARLEQNLLKSTLGRVRLLDALNGNLATATNIVTGREPLVEKNNEITVASTPIGKGVDFLQRVSGVEFPWVEIPGDYLTNPIRQTERRNVPNNEVARTLQDASGAILSIFGVKRRPLENRKPSDILIEYTGSGTKQYLYDLLSKSKYAPNYTTTARSQNSSKIFSYVDKLAQGAKNILGVEAPEGVAYIGDDRGNDVKNAMSDLNGNIVKSNYYLSLMFDSVQSDLFEKQKNTSEGGQVSGKLTWISVNSNNKRGENNDEYNIQSSKLESSLSTNFEFREDSILGYTQELLNSLPKGGEGRSHIANVIDQTSRIFNEGQKYLSRGSSVKYVDKFTGVESGVEYCRTWTKDRPYLSYSDTMKKGGNTRKFDGSIISNPWNLNIAPMSNGKKGFENSSNIFNGYEFGTDKDNNSFYAKKYMFSIENLAWKTSNSPGFTVLDLPVCERGPNGGRIMWFPPYDLKVSEQNNAKWDENVFIGRPEPLYTYNNTTRSGTLSFKIVVDHPSILNLLTREFFENMSDEESENYINAFFAGCDDLDFYDLIRRYSTLDPTDIEYIRQYLNDSKNVKPEVVQKYKTVLGPTVNSEQTTVEVKEETIEESKSIPPVEFSLRFDNNEPGPKETLTSSKSYTELYNGYNIKVNDYQNNLQSDLNTLNGLPKDKNVTNDRIIIYGVDKVVTNDDITKQTDELLALFNKIDIEFSEYNDKITEIKNSLIAKKTSSIDIKIHSSTSSIDKPEYNLKLSHRRSYSIIKDILDKLTNDGKTKPTPKWVTTPTSSFLDYTYKFKEDLGYDFDGELKFNIINLGETDKQCANKDFKKVFRLNYVAPIAVQCRYSQVKISYVEKLKTVKKTEIPTTKTIQQVGPTSIALDGTISIPTKVQKPPIDVMKRIIMKTLSECFYFKKLEEYSPMVFNSLREKLRYFHPAFHSMTPEGLNARLTFINQCLRPGDTIPIKGLASSLDIDARNTTFGPPPICVIRIGDFYHSKVVIRDAQISYDDSPWDMNPEGIGYQPMIATVTLQVAFIGGHGLEKPVERLQNALSSNFYANTEIYDERSIPTNTTINGINADKFTKEFLEDLQNRNTVTPPPENVNKGNNLRDGTYIGEFTNNSLSYSKLVFYLHECIRSYFDVYEGGYNILISKYGTKLSDLILSNTYRTIKTYDVWTPTDSISTPSESFELIGLYPKGKDLFLYSQSVKMQFLNSLLLQDICLIFGFDKFMDSNLMSKTNEEYLNTYIKNEITKLFDEMSSDKTIKEIEDSRDVLISAFDSLNFIVKHGKDFKINSDTETNTSIGIEAILNDFSKNDLYDEYEYGIDYIKENSIKFYEDLDNSIDFNYPNISSIDVEDILRVLVKPKILEIINLFNTDSVYTNKIIMNMVNSLNKFVKDLPKEKKFKFKRYKKINENYNLKYDISSVNENVQSTENIFIDGTKLNQPIVEVTDKLNFYKTKLQ